MILERIAELRQAAFLGHADNVQQRGLRETEAILIADVFGRDVLQLHVGAEEIELRGCAGPQIFLRVGDETPGNFHRGSAGPFKLPEPEEKDLELVREVVRREKEGYA